MTERTVRAMMEASLCAGMMMETHRANASGLIVQGEPRFGLPYRAS